LRPLRKLFGVRAKWPWRRSYEKTRIWFNAGAEDTEYTYGMVLLDSLGRLMLSSPTSRGDIAAFS